MHGTYRFDNGRVWRRNEPYYFHYGLIPRPEAFVVEYSGRFFLFVDAVSDPEVGNYWTAARPCEVVEVGQPEEGGGRALRRGRLRFPCHPPRPGRPFVQGSGPFASVCARR